MKSISVVAALIFRTNQFGKLELFATKRGYGDWRGWWEFPGGKIEVNESPEVALAREILEELATEISVEKLIDIVEYDYPDFHLSMYCFACEIIKGNLKLIEHEDSCWLTKESIHSVNWLPADETILNKIEDILN